jgi:SNF2 family DNA or RNA helicase
MAVKVERDGNRIMAFIPWMEGRGKDLAKEVAGRKPIWKDGKFVCWSYPLTMATCLSLREVFGEDLQIGPRLWEWASAEKGRHAELKSTRGLTGLETVELETVWALAPNMAEAMENRGYQTVGARFGALARRFILADAPGLGKSLESMGALLEGGLTEGRVLIVAPRSSLNLTWANEIRKWLGSRLASVTVATGTKAQREKTLAKYLEVSSRPTSPNHTYADLHFLIINAEMVRWRPARKAQGKRPAVTEKVEYPDLHRIPWDAIIGDEVHKYLMKANPRAKQVSAVGYGFQKLRLADNGMKFALTGTPMKGKPKNLWGTLHWLYPETYTSQWGWMERYFKSKANAYTGSGKEFTNDLLPGAEEKMAAELAPIMIRRTKPELRKLNPAWAPPDKEYFDIWVEMTPEQEKAYREVEQDAEIYADGRILSINGMLAECTRFKQAAGCAVGLTGNTLAAIRKGENPTKLVPRLPSAKLDWLVEDFLPRRGISANLAEQEGNNKVVIGSQFTSMIKLWSNELNRLGIPNFALTGETSDKDREWMGNEFQKPDSRVRVFFLNTNAGGVSITLDAADDMVIMDETWVPDEQEQLEDRIHRTSRVDHYVNIYYVRTKGTIEEEIAESNAAKDLTQKTILDGDAAVEWFTKRFNARAEAKAKGKGK